MATTNLSNLPENVITKRSNKVLIAYLPIPNSDVRALSADLRNQVYESWKGSLSVIPLDAIEIPQTPRLRQPQISALFKILAHLTNYQTGVATVVMPTGTGKTETMLAAACGLPTMRTLVIVPSDSLRMQTFEKFLTLGKLRELQAINSDALNPVVALLDGEFNDEDLSILLEANVIVTTPQSLSKTNTARRDRFFEDCSHLFVDEAHHVTAKTWTNIKNRFLQKPVVQFTATPFRADRQKVDGKIIFNFPISMAQQMGVFRNITFKSVYEVNNIRGDERVAEEAVAQLRLDLDQGFDHLLMARCNFKRRATEVFDIYQERYPDLNPILIHSGTLEKSKKLQAIKDRRHRIIVCVNMLGEGFDLPELKVCALHDIHKSLAITLQFAGRFVRDREDLGNPTFVANVCDQQVEDSLKDLYIEDPDWNRVLQRISESTIEGELELQHIGETGEKTGIEVPLENVHPALSALVYRAESMLRVIEVNSLPLESKEILFSSLISSEQNLIVLLTKVDIVAKWAPQADLIQPEWRLVLLYFVPTEKLLFIHDSSKSGSRKRLANSVCANARLLEGDNVFKSFGRIERLALQNAGLNRGRRGPLRYVMYTGIDIEPAINELAQGGSYKSNLFGKGYEEGNKVSIGCSYKGRIWSMDHASITDWMLWCRNLGSKLNDQNIDPNTILDRMLRTNEITALPTLTPIAIDWPDQIYNSVGLSNSFLFTNGIASPLDEADIELVGNSPEGILFRVSYLDIRAEFCYQILEEGYIVSKLAGDNIRIGYENSRLPLETYFSEESSPSIYFEDGSKVFETLHIVRPDNFRIPQINRNLIRSENWNVNIRNESQGEEKNPDTIQYFVIQKLLEKNYWIIFNDDGANEIADIVAIKDEGAVLAIEFYHLKYSSADNPGSRVTDFYEVCGQIIKGCKWVGELDNIVDHMKRRERIRAMREKTSRFEKGEFRDFEAMKQHGGRLRKEYRFVLIQPGLDTQNVSEDVAALLGSIDLYVKETTGINLKVIGS